MVSLVNPNSQKAVLNLFADYIVDKINSNDNIHQSIIKVTDLNNFVVVNGNTTSKKVLNLLELKNSFIEKYKIGFDDLFPKNFNIIDLIVYNKGPFWGCSFNYVFYNSERPCYHPKVIDGYKDMSHEIYINSLSYNNGLIYHVNSTDCWQFTDRQYDLDYLIKYSEFPCGFGGDFSSRYIFYYCEYVCNHLFDYLNTDEIYINVNIVKENFEDDILLEIKCDSHYNKELIKSLVLDIFDFNIPKFVKEYLSDYKFEMDSTEPFGKKPWLVKDRIKDILIV